MIVFQQYHQKMMNYTIYTMFETLIFNSIFDDAKITAAARDNNPRVFQRLRYGGVGFGLCYQFT